MKRTNLIFVTISMIASLMLSACSDDSEPNTMAWDPSIVSSSFSSNAAYSETNRQVSSSSTEDFLEQRKFSNYLSQFVSPGENSINFDSHVLAVNAYSISSKCADVMVRLDEEDDMIFLNSISEESIAECFPKTAPLLKNKFSSNVKFYAVLVEVGADPLFVILNKLTNDEISFVEVHPGGDGCILSTWVIETIFLIADTDGIIKDGKMPPYTGKLFRSDIWKCDESGRHIPSVKNFGEWYSDSLL